MSVLVGCLAPEIATDAVWGDDSVRPFLLASSRARYVVLLFYPLDFTPASSSELIAIEQRIGDFIRRGVDVAGCSVDSTFTHRAWKQTPLSEGGVGQLSYPLIGDVKHEVCHAYGVQSPLAGSLRATFVIDREGVVQYQVINSLAAGRDIDELLRVIDALRQTESDDTVRPGGSRKARVGMTPAERGVARYLAAHSDML